MPELPDLTIYLEHIERRLLGERLEAIRLASPFVLRTVTPTVEEVCGHRLLGTRRLGKQIVLALENDCYLVIHLMIAGRLQWGKPGAAVPRGRGLAAFDFESGCLIFTEASKKKRASLKLIRGADDLAALDPGGLEVLEADRAAFAARLLESNHTLKRALTDQKVFAGIGNAYSDEILLRSGLSPFKRPVNLTEAEMTRLHDACVTVLTEWTARLRAESGENWPMKVTAFHREMAVHGKYRAPCPVCGSPVQRIVYAENEANYCAKCQTEGRLLADRSLSRLLKDNWPKRLEDLE